LPLSQFIWFYICTSLQFNQVNFVIRNRWSYWKGKLGLSVVCMRTNWNLEVKQSHAPFFCSFTFFGHSYICSHLHVCIYVSFHLHKLKMTIDYFQTQLQQKTYKKKRGCDKFGRITKACLIGRKQQFLDYNFTYYIVFNLGMEKKICSLELQMTSKYAMAVILCEPLVDCPFQRCEKLQCSKRKLT